MSLLREFFHFLTLRGSRVHPDDISARLSRRAAGRPLAAVIIGARNVQVARAVWKRGRLVVSDVVDFTRELSDRDLGMSLTSDVIAAIKSRSPKGNVVVGIATRVAAKMSDCDQQAIEQLEALDGSNESEPDRAFFLWNEPSRKMIRVSVAAVDVRSIERVVQQEGLKLLRLAPMPFLLLNGLLAHEVAQSPASGVCRLPMVLDESMVQVLITSADGTWQDLRAAPVFSAKQNSEVAPVASPHMFTEPLKTLVQSLCRNLKHDGPVELLVLDTGRPGAGWTSLQEAAVEFNSVHRENGSQLLLKQINGGQHLDFYALCLHP